MTMTAEEALKRLDGARPHRGWNGDEPDDPLTKVEYLNALGFAIIPLTPEGDVETMARAMETKRRELIASPLARIYSDLARAAYAALVAPHGSEAR